MTPEQLRSLLRLRLDQAHETLREAEILSSASALRGAVNRAYYAMFYALLALFATRQIGTSKHSGALGLFDREFVKAGAFSPNLSRTLRMAFDRRQRSDYGETVQIDQDSTRQTLDDAAAFLSAIEEYLRAHGHLTDAK